MSDSAARKGKPGVGVDTAGGSWGAKEGNPSGKPLECRLSGPLGCGFQGQDSIYKAVWEERLHADTVGRRKTD